MPKSASLVLAYGIAITAVLWGLSLLLPALGQFLVILWQGLLAGVGLGIAAATTGFATAGIVSEWVPKVASVGLATGGASATIYVVNRIVHVAKRNPYEWILPSLGLLAVFCVDLTKDLLIANAVERALYALVTGLLTIGGGLLLMQKAIGLRAIGFILPFIPSVAVWLLLLRSSAGHPVLSEFILSGSTGAIGFVGVFMFGLITAITGILIPTLDRPEHSQ